MEYTVGVPTYQRPDCVSTLLDTLLDQTKAPDEIIIIDDSPDDRTERIVRDLDSEFACRRITLRYRNRTVEASMPGARNEILRTASGDVVCFLDDDVACNPSWLEHLHQTYTDSPGVAAVGGPAIVVDSERNPASDLVHENRNMNVINRYGEIIELADRWIPDRPIRTDTLSGANMSFKRDVLREVGGFDTEYKGPAFREETDVFAKLLHRNIRVVYHPDVFVFHFKTEHGGSRKSDSGRSPHYWLIRNHIRFIHRNFSSTMPVGLLRLLVYTQYTPPPLWKHVAAAVVDADPSSLWSLKGYLDGLYYEVDLF